MLKRTPLFEAHQRLNARLVEFGGWEMPVQYSSIVEEHLAVRNSGGLFDISHMGELMVTGADAGAFLNRVLTNDVRKLEVGLGHYTHLCNERGGVIDDLYLYRLEDHVFLLIVNASRVDVDVPWLERMRADLAGSMDVAVRDVSDQMGAVAVQGPAVVRFIDGCFPGTATGGTRVPSPSSLRKNQIARFESSGRSLWIARTGYTGEDGFEIVTESGAIGWVWDRLLADGGVHGLKPAGLGARDTLRTEVCYPLHGHELDEQTTPIEAGLGVFVALDKGDFVGRDVLVGQKERGVAKRCVAFRMAEKSPPPRPHYPIWAGDGDAARTVGLVTSGTQSPSLGAGIGLGYVPPELAAPGTAVAIEIRGRRFPAGIVKKPIFKKTL